MRGVDATRCVALLGMLAVNVLPSETFDEEPTLTTLLLAGRASALFAVLAGVSLAFISGGRHRFHGRPLLAARAGLAVRAVLVLGLGLGIAYADPGVAIILAYYGVMFLLAVPLLGLAPWWLAALAAGFAIIPPTLLVGLQGRLPAWDTANPTFTDVVADPLGSAGLLTLTGFYPALPWMAYLCAGLAIGRLDLSSRRTATWLLAGGVLLAAAAWAVSAFLLGAGGFDRLVDSSPGNDPEDIKDVLVYGAGEGLPGRSWWWLAIAAPYSSMPLELLHTIGTSAAALGLVLLLGKTFDPIIGALAPAGSMTLTLYSAHLLFMASGILSDRPFASLAVQAGTAVIFAVVWRWARGKGPLEAALGAVSERVRTMVGTAGSNQS
ncbi:MULTISPECIES: heparan-alpha-glucosaminide N-acetyltransferase domain-containing protein [Micrococcaceae]|uniref:heparan-alpha-glucosaminide N-acetyltransferase domain-containing protein n=1 Tax=Micrococcaceae TaxID=1268 RepID=UPI0005C135C2|nr:MULTISPECIES: heparan-alpha-glucosaminide N-acetyltransferase domain-containing protein [Micrococcaceae]